ADTGLFRFANLDVFEVQEGRQEGRLGRLRHTEKKIETTDLEFFGEQSDFFIICRNHLMDNIDSSSRQKLLDIEEKILEKLEADERRKM
ncbi:MAG: hypothetical protein ACFFEE_10975, partial [Candidatus Thorarchaeota archaeon]